MSCGTCTFGALVVSTPPGVAGTELVAAVELDEPDTLELVVVEVVVVGGAVVVPLVGTWTLEVVEFSGGVTSTGTSVSPGGSTRWGAGFATVSPTGISTRGGAGAARAVDVDGGAAVWVPPPAFAPPVGSATSARVSMEVADCRTVTTESVSRPCHLFPVYSSPTCVCVSASGLPESQRTRGIPRRSIITAVPVCSTDWKAVARPFSKR